jgi:hypothetical protein
MITGQRLTLDPLCAPGAPLLPSAAAFYRLNQENQRQRYQQKKEAEDPPTHETPPFPARDIGGDKGGGGGHEENLKDLDEQQAFGIHLFLTSAEGQGRQ